MKSYFSNPHQFVSINGVNSKKHLLLYWVPQGSLFGPFNFPKYTPPNISYHLYTDDMQLYVVFKSGDGPSAASQLEVCIKEIRSSMNANMLKLNNDKTEFLAIGSKHLSQHTPAITTIRVGDDQRGTSRIICEKH